MSSNLAPLSLGPIVARLEDQLTGWKQISGAADLSIAEKSKAPTTPAAYVLLASDQPSAARSGSGRYRQRVSGRFGVILALRDHNAKQKGTAKADELNERIVQVRAALIGWQHPGVDQGFTTRLGGPCALVGFRNNVIWWQEIYTIDYDIFR